MRVVVLTLHHPWRRDHGGTLRTRALVEGFAALGHDVVCLHPGPREQRTPGFTDVGTGSSPRGQCRSTSALRAVKRHFLPMPTSFGAHDPALVGALRDVAPCDVLVVAEAESAARYHAAAPGSALWLDLPDLRSAAAAREAPLRGLLARRTSTLQAASIARREAEAVSGAAAVTVAGWQDAAALSDGAHRVRWLPTPVDVVPAAAVGPAPVVPTAGFIGNFAHRPNLDAYHVLCRHWVPALVAAGWHVVVAGHDSECLPRHRDVELVGAVGTPAEFYERITITLAPIRLGGGIKVKVLESLAHRRPVVASAFAVEGFHPALRAEVTVVDLERPNVPVVGTTGGVGRRVGAALDRYSTAAFRRVVAQCLDDAFVRG